VWNRCKGICTVLLQQKIDTQEGIHQNARGIVHFEDNLGPETKGFNVNISQTQTPKVSYIQLNKARNGHSLQ